jgi:hypothetical protein|nr:hypothetical protein [Kofleriaceae bacterium]
MLTGAHVLIFSTDRHADSAFLRDVLALPSVDAGDNRLIFGLPPAEVALHEAEAAGGKHELWLICDDIQAFAAAMADKQVACDPIAERGWGSVSAITLPSGLKLSIYEAHHARPVAKKGAGKALRETARVVRKATKKAKKAAKKVATTSKADKADKKAKKPAKAAKSEKADKKAAKKAAKSAKRSAGTTAAGTPASA